MLGVKIGISKGKLCQLWDGREKKNNGPCAWMMQFPYFNRDKGGRLLESLLRDPQDVLRKKSEQSCTLALGAVEVHGREAFTSFTPLYRRPRGSPWSAGVAASTRDAVTPLCEATGLEFTIKLQWLTWIESAAMRNNWKRKKVECRKLQLRGNVFPGNRHRPSALSFPGFRVEKVGACRASLQRIQAVRVFPVASRQEALNFVRFHCLWLRFLSVLSANVFLLSKPFPEKRGFAHMLWMICFWSF